jgi:RHS repeat-associated protein
VTNNLRFPGQYDDGETGLHYNGARYYASIGGRYLVWDPAGIAAGANVYLYADANPVGFFDATGRRSTGASSNSGGSRTPRRPPKRPKRPPREPIDPGYNWPDDPFGDLDGAFDFFDFDCHKKVATIISGFREQLEAQRRALNRCQTRCFLICVEILETLNGSCPGRVVSLIASCPIRTAAGAGKWWCARGKFVGTAPKECCSEEDETETF